MGMLLLFNTLLMVATSYVLMVLMDDVLPQNDLYTLINAIGLYILICIIQLFFSFFVAILQRRFSLSIENKVKEEIIRKIFLSIRFDII